MRYIPKGVCSQAIDIELDGEIVTKVQFTGGCHGNLQGIARLVEGMNAKDAIAKIQGIRCGFKSTSCPDQLACALTAALEQNQ